MSRFADPRAEAEVDLGPCECPGTPHDADRAWVRAEFSARELVALGRETARLAASDADDAMVADALAPYVLRWNLIGPDGRECQPTPELLSQLKAPTLTAVIEAISGIVTAADTVPNPSGARSAASSPASASPTP